MRFRQDENGQMLVLTALSIVALLGFLALAVDMGLLFRSKRQVQTAADAGAIAAALEYSYNGTTNMGSVAGTAVSSNGVTLSYTPTLNTDCPDTTHNCAIVRTTGINGYHNTAGYVQVTAVQANPTFFMGMFGDSNVRTAASAIAGIEPNPDCLITLDPSSDHSFWIKGNSNIVTPNCGIQVNSNSKTAVCIQGSAGINGPYLKIHGGQDTSGQCGKNPGAPVYSGSGTSSDPLATEAASAPTLTSCTTGAGGNTYLGTTLTDASLLPTPSTAASGNLSDGVYCFQNNVTIGGSGALTMPPGIYIFENGVTIGNSAVTFGTQQATTNSTNYNGATLDIYGGSFDNTNGNLSVYGPSGSTTTLNGIAIYQPATNLTATCQDPSIKNAINTTTCLQAQFGSSNLSNIVGYIYAPAATVYLQDEGGGLQATGVVADDFYNNSSLTITNSYNSYNPSTTPLSTIALVE
ncbi:MAG TPA: pilus assembly protein TadG-related protein [Terracidiphilus sp.]|nr:pilus assembly protein TadG-related protein [Terracidiphilus sp.]